MKFPSKFKAPEHSPGFLLWQVTNRWQRRQREALAKIDLTHVQFVLLACALWLESLGRTVNQKELAQMSAVDVMMASQVIRALEKKKCMRREKNPKDARAFLLFLTEKGKKLTQEGLAIVEEVDQAFFSKAEGDLCKTLLMLNQ